jgi:excinuclease UvrABC ATPase subunit
MIKNSLVTHQGNKEIISKALKRISLGGGSIVAEGNIKKIMSVKHSHTGMVLKAT